MKSVSIVVGCLNDGDIPSQIKNNIIVIEAFDKNIECIKKYKCYHYFVSNKSKNINLYYSNTIEPELYEPNALKTSCLRFSRKKSK